MGPARCVFVRTKSLTLTPAVQGIKKQTLFLLIEKDKQAGITQGEIIFFVKSSYIVFYIN
jgi:hypothetical protein